VCCDARVLRALCSAMERCREHRERLRRSAPPQSDDDTDVMHMIILNDMNTTPVCVKARSLCVEVQIWSGRVAYGLLDALMPAMALP
jgi:hypothetical protein